MLTIVQGTMVSLQASVESSEKTLAANGRMVAGTKDTGGAKSPKVEIKIRPMTEYEREIIQRELRDELEAGGEERDPTAEEVRGCPSAEPS